MSAAEFSFWQDFRRQFGFPEDRIEAAVVNSGAYVGGVWGGEAEAEDLRPVFGPRRRTARRAMVSLSTAAGVRVRDGRRK
jgi:hypothetical protein